MVCTELAVYVWGTRWGGGGGRRQKYHLAKSEICVDAGRHSGAGHRASIKPSRFTTRRVYTQSRPLFYGERNVPCDIMELGAARAISPIGRARLRRCSTFIETDDVACAHFLKYMLQDFYDVPENLLGRCLTKNLFMHSALLGHTFSQVLYIANILNLEWKQIINILVSVSKDSHVADSQRAVHNLSPPTTPFTVPVPVLNIRCCRSKILLKQLDKPRA
ncbi:hypothetical protein EVAR_44322_1 [Eumeta japonica]|uniref:Uncharacterized protein n=1 Tax=Eumeta variegata TaxID=151549 RepID=A0A4C1X9P2_EUMVA|nr:hypothetical protein EVAR_44322_1 [Eumeta japonica]